MLSKYIFEKSDDFTINAAKSFLDKNYQDILTNFDPDIIKLRKKRKIIMASGVLDGLNRISSEEEVPE